MMGYLLSLEMHVRLVGVLLLILAALNLFLPKRFGWGVELQRLTLLTRQVFIVHCVFIVLMLVMMGVLALFCTGALLEHTRLGTLVLFGLGLFWTLRLGMQLFFYSRKLWVGNRLNTAMHILFSGVWAYFAAVFGAAWVLSMR